MPNRPPFVVRSGDLPEEEASHPAPFAEEKFTFGRNIGSAAGSRRLGVRRERLVPGRRTNMTHAHSAEEEIVYVLVGRPILRWIPPGAAAEECALAPGDCAIFPAGTGIAHTIVNRSTDDVELLVVGERRPGDRVVYPEDTAFSAWHVAQRPFRAWTDAFTPSPTARWPAHRVETERLVLRTWEAFDAFALLSTIDRNRAHLLPFVPRAVEVVGLDGMAERIREWQRAERDSDVMYGVYEPDGTLVGGTAIHRRVGPNGRELGYWVDLGRQGRGYVTEWCAALVRLCFEILAVDRIEIHCDPKNERSWRVAERLGCWHEGTLARRSPRADGTLHDAMIWTLFADAYPASPAASRPVRAWDALGRRLL